MRCHIFQHVLKIAGDETVCNKHARCGRHMNRKLARLAYTQNNANGDEYMFM